MKTLSWQTRLKNPYMVGVYLATNAVKDAVLVVDGPDCLFFKGEYVHGTHDLHSTLLDPAGNHRIAHTLADTVNVVMDREPQLRDLMARVAQRDGVKAVLVSALPMASITGSQYDRLAGEVSEIVGVPIMEVPAKSLQTDWLDGYSEVLNSLARGLPFESGQTKKGSVAIVGPLVHRLEGDVMADLAELTRLCEEYLDLSVVSIWPSGSGVEDLAKIALAETIIALPAGVKAGKILSRRLDAKLVHVPQPFGTAATGDFLNLIAQATGRSELAKKAIAAGNALVHDTVKNVIPAGTKLALVAEPGTLAGFAGFAKDIGAIPASGISSANPPFNELPGLEVMENAGQVDLCITNSRGAEACIDRKIPFMEFGYPSYGTHYLTHSPTLGYFGVINMTDRIANALRWWAAATSLQPTTTGPSTSA